ncbi:hypothetical protein B1757_04285 [Acidithiobacillus marinus]|uniref:Uncharacterized protein n=1 Tax=Acidithiobacillus marinus TaxID=187490 RepID=A0A2I1DNJ9_9PROT|nr:hypothetical protein [Acidithiobacillus marinus]PKY11443.1 hypothetical protein B1757_04285 [Acidithiobacillus marinus]
MSSFAERYRGMLWGIKEWSRWDAFVETLSAHADDGWYVYFVGVDYPKAPLKATLFRQRLEAISVLLHQDHREKYLGIVYVDDFDNPQLIKIYDPNNLGASCGSSGKLVPPGWILSRMAPDNLGDFIVPEGRKRWWRELPQG